MLTGISCTCSRKCSFFPPISPFTLALFTLFAMLPCAGAGSILDFTQQLGFRSAQFSLVAIMAMLHLIWSHQNVFQQHYLQILGSDSNVHASAWVQRITAWIFRQPVFADLEIPAQEQVRLVMQAADGLGLAEANNFAIRQPSPQVICTESQQCEACGGWLQIRCKAKSIWILEDTGPQKGSLLAGSCHFCGTIHYPDRWNSLVNGVVQSVYNSGATYLCIGGSVWASQSLATTQTHLRHATHISTEGFAAWYNNCYPLPGFELLPEQTWRMFVYHEGLRMCTQAGIQLTVPQYSTILNIVCALQHQFYPGTVKLVPGGMDHYCTECTQPYRTHMEVPVPNPHGRDVAPNTLNGQLLVRYSTWFNSDLHLTSHARITM